MLPRARSPLQDAPSQALGDVTEIRVNFRGLRRALAAISHATFPRDHFRAELGLPGVEVPEEHVLATVLPDAPVHPEDLMVAMGALQADELASTPWFRRCVIQCELVHQILHVIAAGLFLPTFRPALSPLASQARLPCRRPVGHRTHW